MYENKKGLKNDDKNSSFNARRRLLPHGRTGRNDRKSRRRLAPFRRYGRAFRAQYNLRRADYKSIRDKSSLVFDVHLMISDPLKYVPDFVKAGADVITFHIESDSPSTRLLTSSARRAARRLSPSSPALPSRAFSPISTSSTWCSL